MNEQRLAAYRHQLVSANLAEFGDTAEALNWISPGRAMAAQTERGKRLQSMGQRLHLAFKGTKPHIGPLSPGCRICGERIGPACSSTGNAIAGVFTAQAPRLRSAFPPLTACPLTGLLIPSP